MDKITKKDFKALHDNNKLSLIGSFEIDKETILNELNKLDKIYTEPTSRVDIANVKGYLITNIYQDNKFIFVENNITDKMYGTSVYNICYLLK